MQCQPSNHTVEHWSTRQIVMSSSLYEKITPMIRWLWVHEYSTIPFDIIIGAGYQIACSKPETHDLTDFF
jgi:hypothetical protein